MIDLPPRPAAPLPVGISQCLLGDEVRYDGTGARSSLPHDRLGGLFEYKSFCPEMGIGMGTPRAPIRLVDAGDGAVRVVGVKDDSIDKTAELKAFGERAVGAMGGLVGYVFMHNSPSCGLFRVKVYQHRDAPARRIGRGIYAATVTERIPHLPVEDAGRLFDDVLRENFVTRVFAYAHWRTIADELTPGRLIAFHTAYKYLLMAHDVPAYQAAGRLLSDLKNDFEAKAQAYLAVLMGGLTNVATRKKHANVMAHLQGFLKKNLDGANRQELERVIHSYRRGELPLLAPLTLLKHHFRRFPDEWVEKQSYLEPHPEVAALRKPL